jgi:light-regulated signal transduction histidine kinase (bacteriophytochrome)
LSRTDAQREEVNLSAMVRSIAARMQSEEPDRQVEFIIQPRVTATGDFRLFEVMMSNLLGNAWKFTGKQPSARIEFARAEMEGQHVYYIRDNGAGFDMRYAGRLFGAFERLHQEAQFPGTGIGLATVRRIVNRHGGRVWAEGEVGKGATFYFVLKESGP